MNCPYCGTFLSENSKQCPNCKKEIPIHYNSSSQIQHNDTPKLENKKSIEKIENKKSKEILLLTISCFISLILAILSIWFSIYISVFVSLACFILCCILVKKCRKYKEEHNNTLNGINKVAFYIASCIMTISALLTVMWFVIGLFSLCVFGCDINNKTSSSDIFNQISEYREQIESSQEYGTINDELNSHLNEDYHYLESLIS